MTPEEATKQMAEQAITSNDAWQQRSLNYLIQKIDYLHQKNIIGVQKSDHDWLGAKSNRLLSRIDIMERYGIESAPSPYNAEAMALFTQAHVLVEAIIADEKAKQTPVEPEQEEASV